MKTYTCPMHPEIKSDKPGKCPKCGMELTEINTLHTKSTLAIIAFKADKILT